MARTKASVGSKVSSGKSSKARCCAAPPPATSISNTAERASKSYGGGNPVCPRDTPGWQRPITNFFVCTDERSRQAGDEAASSSQPKRDVITSDDEDVTATAAALDEAADLEPLTGEECHKIEEYYPQNGVKGKGVGKKTRGKENDNNNAPKRGSVKRDLEVSDEEIQNTSKKVKVK